MTYKPCQYPHCPGTFPAAATRRKYCDRCVKRIAADNSAAYWRRKHPQAAQAVKAAPPLTDTQRRLHEKRESLKAEYERYLERKEASA